MLIADLEAIEAGLTPQAVVDRVARDTHAGSKNTPTDMMMTAWTIAMSRRISTFEPTSCHRRRGVAARRLRISVPCRASKLTSIAGVARSSCSMAT